MIIVCGHAEQNCPTTFLGALQRLSWPFDDPAAVQGTDAEILAKFRAVRDQMDERIRAWLAGQGIAVQASPVQFDTKA